jgi:hypothetical protein
LGDDAGHHKDVASDQPPTSTTDDAGSEYEEGEEEKEKGREELMMQKELDADQTDQRPICRRNHQMVVAATTHQQLHSASSASDAVDKDLSICANEQQVEQCGVNHHCPLHHHDKQQQQLRQLYRSASQLRFSGLENCQVGTGGDTLGSAPVTPPKVSGPTHVGKRRSISDSERDCWRNRIDDEKNQQNVSSAAALKNSNNFVETGPDELEETRRHDRTTMHDEQVRALSLSAASATSDGDYMCDVGKRTTGDRQRTPENVSAEFGCRGEEWDEDCSSSQSIADDDDTGSAEDEKFCDRWTGGTAEVCIVRLICD